MSYSNPGPGGYGPPQQPGQPPAGGYAYPQSAPGYGYPNQGASYPAAPPVGYPQAPGYAMPMQPSNGMGTTGLVLGIIGVVCSLTFFLWFFGVILGILGSSSARWAGARPPVARPPTRAPRPPVWCSASRPP